MSAGPHRSDMTAVREPSLLDGDAVAPSSRAPIVTATNVVPFTPVRRETVDAAPALAFDPTSRPAPYWPRREHIVLMGGLLAVSLLAHAVLYLLFNRPPEPMASVGVEAVSVELVLGGEKPAGLATDAGPDTTQATPADDPDPKPTDVDTADPEPPQPVQTTEAAPPEVKEAKPEESSEPPPPEPPPPQQVVALSVEPPPPEPPPPEPQAAPPEQPRPVPPRETQPKPDVKPKAQRADKRTRTASREPEATGPRANTSGGIGVGRSQRDTNWNGLVYAHLARYKTASHTQKGVARVKFWLDRGGRVTRVSLVASSGVANLDEAAQSMVRRASPFPPPPLGVNDVTVPIRFGTQ